MPITRRQPGQCIFCAFRLATRSSTSGSRCTRRAPSGIRQDVRTFATAAPQRAQEITSQRNDDRPLIRNVGTIRKDGNDWVSSNRPLVRRVGRDENTPVQDPWTQRSGDRRGTGTKFKRVVLDRLDAIEPRLRESPIFEGKERNEIDKALGGFRWWIREQLNATDTTASTMRGSNFSRRGTDRFGSLAKSSSPDTDIDTASPVTVTSKLFQAMKEKGHQGLDAELQYTLYTHILTSNFTPADLHNQRALADLRHPTEWFPKPRMMHRTIHAHIGPTNSGKTYHALKRLETAKAGLYAGPLRLLAHEVYTRLSAKGKICALVTGEEQRLPRNWKEGEREGRVVAATVEMTSLSSEYDVAVIDEIQMLGSLERGFAWTQALLGLCAREIHVCGETRSLPILRELAAASGDKLVVHEYERLTRLQMDKDSLRGSFAGLRKGDCIVTFSVVNIHALRTEVEKKTGRKAAVVYGSLPPETRAQQARLFNDPGNDYDYLIASDAVGMGLNLSIKRIIFETIHKFNGGKINTLSVSEIRQIAGRAGRYRTSQQALEAAKDEQIAPLSSMAPAETISNDGGLTSGDQIELRLDADEPTELKTSEDEPIDEKKDNNTSMTFLDRLASIVSSASPSPESQSRPPWKGRNPAANPQPPDPSSSTSTPEPTALSTRAAFDAHTIGLVTTIDAADFEIVRRALDTEPPSLTFATIQPPPGIIQRFASYFPPGTPFSYILLRLTELSNTTSRYRIWHKSDTVMLADLIHGVKGLSVEDRMIFINAPVGIRDTKSPQAKLLKELATCIGSQTGGSLLSLSHLPLDILDSPTAGTKPRLKELEELHKGLVLYLWLSFRFPGVFVDRPLGNYVKEMVEGEIEETLRLMTFVDSRDRREAVRTRLEKIVKKKEGSKIEAELDRLARDAEARKAMRDAGKEGTERDASVESQSDESERTDLNGGSGATPMHVELLANAASVEEGESMPADDEGIYADEEVEVEVTARDGQDNAEDAEADKAHPGLGEKTQLASTAS